MVASETDDPSEDLGDVNRILIDANQMLLDLRNEIQGKELVIKTGENTVEELRSSIALKQIDFETLEATLKEERMSKKKLVS